MNIRARKEAEKKAEKRSVTSRRLFTYLRSNGVIIVALIVGVYAVLRLVISVPDPAQVRFVETHSEEADPQELRSGIPETGFSGKTYETAQRLREAGALGMAVSLTAFATFAANGKLPPSERAILDDLVNRNLRPPGIEIKGENIRSELSLIRFRYRREPFTFEIVSLPKNASGDPTFLLRFPLPPGEPNSVMYFQSLHAESDQLPEAFSTTEQLSAAGWGIRHWRGETLSLEDSAIRELHENDSWLRSLNPKLSE
ncbi:MAG: hypothetical protein ABI999_16265 [Acidobacteriota bacterium]